MSNTKTSQAEMARKMGVSRQRVWQILRVQNGKCASCGRKRDEEDLTLGGTACADCRGARRRNQQQRLGHGAWKPGSPGRPILEAAKED